MTNLADIIPDKNHSRVIEKSTIFFCRQSWVTINIFKRVASPRAHVSPLHQQLHWLPVSSRLQYELCMLMHDVYHSKAPGYLTALCVSCGDTRLRSSSRGDFVVQRTRLRLAEKSFSVAGPCTWNSLPSHIRTLVSRDSFSRHLKTHFFKLSYDIQWFVHTHVAVLTVYVLVSIFNVSFFSIVGTSEHS